MDKRCISYKELRTILPLSRAHLNRYRNDPKYAGLGFPMPVSLGHCRICWWLHEVLDWLAKRPRG